MASKTSLRRFLIVPEKAFLEAELLRAQDTGSGDREEAGIQVVPPTPYVLDPPVGDVRPVLSGAPEKHLDERLHVTKSGPSGSSRWGYTDDEDNSGLRFKQSPMVVSRFVDCLDQRDQGDSRPYHNNPKLLPINNETGMLALWVAAEKAPIFTANGLDGMVTLSAFDPDSGWDTPRPLIGPDPSAEKILPSGVVPICADFVQFPDTGEIVMAVFTENTAITDRRLYIFSGTSNGSDWEESTRLFFEGDPADLDVGALLPINSCAMERLPSGRLVLMGLFNDELVSLVSDTRGAEWKVATTLQWGPWGSGSDRYGASLASTSLHNGAALFAMGSWSLTNVAKPNSLGGWSAQISTFDGEIFKGIAELGADPNPSAMTYNLYGTTVAIVERENGFPMAFGSVMAWEPLGAAGAGPITVEGGRLWAKVADQRGIDLSMSLDDWLANDTTRYEIRTFHHHEAGGTFTSYLNAGKLHYHGWLGMDAVRFRGRLWLAAQWCRQDTGSSNEDPDVDMDSIAILQLESWQALQERLGRIEDAPTAYTAGLIYNHIWDNFDLPNQVGYTQVGIAGTWQSSEDGYLEIDTTAPGVGHYFDSTLPNASTGAFGVVRAICQIEDQGSLAASDAVIRLELVLSAGGATAKVEIRMEESGGSQLLELWDLHAGAKIGNQVSFPTGEWIEILLGVWEDGGTGVDAYAYARSWDRSEDPDWDATFEEIADAVALTPATSVVDMLLFGDFTGGGSKTAWKSVHLHRPDPALNSGLASKAPLATFSGHSYEDSESANNISTSGRPEVRQDAGVFNFMRTSLSSALPAQWVERGERASWRGEAIARGSFEAESEYVFGAPNVQVLPVTREWRSESDAAVVEVVFDSGANSNDRFHPEAISFFGRNWLSVEFQLSEDPTFLSGVVSMKIGANFSGGPAVDRSSVLWTFYQPATWDFDTEDNRLTVYGDPLLGSLRDASPWRPHQFASEETGQKFYLATRSGTGLVYIYRIKDNTEDTLIFFSDLISADFDPEDGNWVIFSDRFAVTIEHEYPAAPYFGDRAVAGPNSHLAGYRYMRLLYSAATHRDADEQFLRLGLAVPGNTFELGSPMPERGWTMEHESGEVLERLNDGASKTDRRSAVRRVWSCDYGYLLPAPDISESDTSPDAQPDRRSWKTWTDLIRRMRLDGLHAALVWEADQAVGTGSDPTVPVQSEPNELAVVRMTSAGSIQNLGYQCQEVLLGGPVVDDVPRPIMAVRGVKFTEEM
ncbi:MAG: hypothetical protein GY871_04440 [Actinomycetales bacterium]|nr:hypothetical protein [Actinomycetales bacterium]